MNEDKQLRFGILCNGLVFQRWQAEIIRGLRADGHQLKLIVLNAAFSNKNKVNTLRKKLPLNQLLYRFCYRFVFKTKWRKQVNMCVELNHVPTQVCHVWSEGYSEYFLPEDVEYIRNQQLDFILRFGFNIIRGEILDVAKSGVWSFHHGDEQQYRGGPPGFWEIYDSNRITGAVLQRLTHRIDGGVILKKGWFGTIKHSYKEQLDHIIGGSMPFVKQVCHDMITDRAEYLDAPPSNTNAQIYRIPGNLQMLVFLLKIIRNRILFHVKDIMLSEHWNIGLIDASPAKVAFNWRRYRGRVRWFKPLPVKLFRADTFFFRHEEKPYVLCERFDYRTMKGLIELITLDKEYRFSSAKTAIDGEGHFSFPFTFSLDNQIYCIPETSATGLTNLYRFNPDIKRFEWERVLINQPLIDPVLVHYQNRWWLFATLPTNASGALYLWFAQSLDEPFIAHPENPVKTDVRSSRAAGPFMVLDGFLYRPAQNASRTYGGSIVINQVISLTPLEYIEQQVVELKPDDDWIFSAGMHTIAGDDKITVIDAKRHQFSPTASFNKLKRKLTYERKKSR